MSTILVAQSNNNILTSQQKMLEEQGYTVELLRELGQLNGFSGKSINGIVLDQAIASVPTCDSISQFRQRFKAPVIVSLDSDDEDVHSLFLELGADEVISKDAKPRLWRARLDAVLRRQAANSQFDDEPEQLSFGQLHIDKNTRRVSYGQERIDLTTHEFELLWLLASNGGKVVKRDFVYEQILGKYYRPDTRTIDVRISRLRKKLHDNPSRPEKIKTIWRQGYLFVTDVWN
ncbi:DNA-binding response regulator [Pseudoalteromonas sp. A22]|uniref:response regulator transcription factor n=1 Tax=Pseudoalteromonas TaxID=53246 RepID=UPI001BA6821F|nr:MULTISPECIES: response regulator transcription factor [Pseudoalteromonas]QUI63899.1 DNA-binding response regulator [Pseudoalteromonas sp. A22]USE69601.1 response regulator [Pseudoalteromonas flavipulchra]